MSVVTTLNFGGRTEEAVEHYRIVLDAEVLMLMRFRECPDSSFLKPGFEDKVFHATIRIGSTELMASDVGCDDPESETSFAGFAFAVRAESIKNAERHFAGLSDQGEVLVPLAETFFATRYGIVKDRFGVSWKITVPGDAEQRLGGRLALFQSIGWGAMCDMAYGWFWDACPILG